MAVTFDDASGRAAWEFSWRLLGTDVLYDTVRFPTTRPQVLVTQLDGTFQEVATKDISLMGAAYAHYTPGGGVECYVVEARAKADWIPDYARPRLLYWLEKRTFYPLRTEMYDRAGRLVQVEVRRTKLVNPELGDRGYAPFIHLYWDIAADILTYNIRDGIRPMEWSAADTLTYFSPDFMRRQWYLEPVRSYLGVERPEEFFPAPRAGAGQVSRAASDQSGARAGGPAGSPGRGRPAGFRRCTLDNRRPQAVHGKAAVHARSHQHHGDVHRPRPGRGGQITQVEV